MCKCAMRVCNTIIQKLICTNTIHTQGAHPFQKLLFAKFCLRNYKNIEEYSMGGYTLCGTVRVILVQYLEGELSKTCPLRPYRIYEVSIE